MRQAHTRCGSFIALVDDIKAFKAVKLTFQRSSTNPSAHGCRGFDVFVNMVLEDVEEFEITPEGTKVGIADSLNLVSDHHKALVAGNPSHCRAAWCRRRRFCSCLPKPCLLSLSGCR